MALSNSTLSGCFEFTPARGFALKSCDFLCLGFFSLAWAVTPDSTSDASANAAKLLDNRFIPPQFAAGGNCHPFMRLQDQSHWRLREPLPAMRVHLVRPALRQTPHCLQPVAPHLLGRPGRPCREPLR